MSWTTKIKRMVKKILFCHITVGPTLLVDMLVDKTEVFHERTSITSRYDNGVTACHRQSYWGKRKSFRGSAKRINVVELYLSTINVYEPGKQCRRSCERLHWYWSTVWPECFTPVRCKNARCKRAIDQSGRVGGHCEDDSNALAAAGTFNRVRLVRTDTRRTYNKENYAKLPLCKDVVAHRLKSDNEVLYMLSFIIARGSEITGHFYFNKNHKEFKDENKYSKEYTVLRMYWRISKFSGSRDDKCITGLGRIISGLLKVVSNY